MEDMFGDKTISALPDDDGFEVTFMRVYPDFKIIKRKIPLEHFSKNYHSLCGELKKAGMNFKLEPYNLRVSDYCKFVRFLFPDFDVEDFQHARKSGLPDFRLSNEHGNFYIEFKAHSDSILPSQISWVGNNPDKESWFLILGKIELDSRQFTGLA